MSSDPVRSGAAAAVVAGALVAVVVALGAANPVPAARISTDRLGPDSGEPVPEYVDRARASLTDTSDDAAERWALVSLGAPVTADGLLAVVGGVRVSQVLLQVPLDRVQTPLAAIPVGADPEAVRRAPAVASARLTASIPGSDRASAVAAYTAAQLSAGCACVVGATVRATPERLLEMADADGVRAVEALPADAVAGAFAVTPLLPSQTVAAVPGPDDGPVPGT
ncbi:hypothetical protein [Prescottella subtropica]|uniref:hypothetical protein n=1 Tax=Prescottella subtropica TaxID=2545757 RepID=UPI0010F7C7E4|nr:hypothetical protein [Prescottella subtropica]